MLWFWRTENRFMSASSEDVMICAEHSSDQRSARCFKYSKGYIHCYNGSSNRIFRSDNQLEITWAEEWRANKDRKALMVLFERTERLFLSNFASDGTLNGFVKLLSNHVHAFMYTFWEFIFVYFPFDSTRWIRIGTRSRLKKTSIVKPKGFIEVENVGI